MCFLDYHGLFLFKIKWEKTLIKTFQSIVQKSKRKLLLLQTDKGSEFKTNYFNSI